MNAKEMIAAMRTLGIGEVYTDDEVERISLVYLNLANEQLYRETANINDDIVIDETLISIPGRSFVSLVTNPFLICEVYRSGYKQEIEGLSRSKFNGYIRRNELVGDPVIYYRKKNIINFYPIMPEIPYTFYVSHAPEITKITLATSESQIPYPVEYHSVLVDGALYYLFQDESGFKNIVKENEAKIRWIDGKASLQSYLFGSDKQSVNTFQNA